MGNCCSNYNVDPSNDIHSNQFAGGGGSYGQQNQMNAYQLAMLIKVQAVIRGYLTRKMIRTMQYNTGALGDRYNAEYDENQNNYDNAKV